MASCGYWIVDTVVMLLNVVVNKKYYQCF